MAVLRRARCSHGFLVRLYTPRQSMALVDLDPADNVRLWRRGVSLAGRQSKAVCTRSPRRTLLCTSRCSMPAMIGEGISVGRNWGAGVARGRGQWRVSGARGGLDSGDKLASGVCQV